ncbi:MAG: 30S ribosomal protein S9, partial [Candidatus Oxydemutatoraceae bacterium WSBS_2016_MAG_OTU14]
MSESPYLVHGVVGRRKRSTARVYLRPGSGKIRVNKRDFKEYFMRESLCMIVQEPFVHVGMDQKFDCEIRVNGGGTSGQAGAVRLSIARALLKYDPDLRPKLNERSFLTR